MRNGPLYNITQVGIKSLTRVEIKRLVKMADKMRKGNRGRDVKGSADLGFLKGR
jgi:hypothetical protein